MGLTPRTMTGGLVAALALFAGVAQAGAQAVDPEEIAQAERIDNAYPFVSPLGEQLVFWKVQAGPERPLAVRVRNGGAFGGAQELSADNNAELPPKVAFDPAGRMIAAWGIATTNALGTSALREPFGIFGAPRDVGPCTRFIDLAYGPGGKLAIACSVIAGPTAPRDQIAYGTRDGIGQIGPSSYPMLSVTDAFLRPDVAWGADGTLSVGWALAVTATHSEVRLVQRPAAGGGSTTLIDSADSPQSVSFEGLAVGPDGTAVVAVTNTVSGVKLYRKPTTGPVQAPLTLAGTDAWIEQIVQDPSGTVHVAVSVPISASRYRTEVRTLSPAGVLSAPVTLLPDTDTIALAGLLVGPDGTEYALLTGDGTTRVARRDAGAASFSAPRTIAGADARWPHAALTAGGDVVVSWTREAAPNDERAVVGGLDSGTPPALSEVKAPAALVAGTAGTFDVTATDAMGLRSVRWDFGDGASAATATAEHAFDAPGRYTATVTATDRAGNTSTAQRDLTVVAVPTPGAIVPGGLVPGTTGGAPTASPDRTPPALRVRLASRVSFTTLRRRGLTVRVSLSEPADLSASLVGRVKRATIARAGDLVLAERSARRAAAGVRTLRLKPSARLLGRRRALRLVVRITATDAAGNRRSVARTVRVKR